MVYFLKIVQIFINFIICLFVNCAIECDLRSIMRNRTIASEGLQSVIDKLDEPKPDLVKLQSWTK